MDGSPHFPRILCLHGGGTNARIFRMQCRAIRAGLGGRFRLVFAQAPYNASPGPDVTRVYQKHGPFRAWLPGAGEGEGEGAGITTEVAAVERIWSALSSAIATDNLAGATGDVVGLLGFSQGARIAASILFAEQACRGLLSTARSMLAFDIRFAVLIAGRGPLVWLVPELPIPPGLVGALQFPGGKSMSMPLDGTPSDSSSEEENDKCNSDSDNNDNNYNHGQSDPCDGGYLLQVPTIHVHGLFDRGLECHQRFLQQYFDPKSSTLIEWYGEHRVPIRSWDVDPVVEQICRIT